jgi:hypothetical protein
LQAEAALQQTKERAEPAMQFSAISTWGWEARQGTPYPRAARAR